MEYGARLSEMAHFNGAQLFEYAHKFCIYLQLYTQFFLSIICQMVRYGADAPVV